MKRILIFVVIAMLGLTINAQRSLTLEECREMALKYNKDLAASQRQLSAAGYTAKSLKGNFFPNITIDGIGLYSNAKGSLGIPGGMLPVFADITPATPTGAYAYFPGMDLKYKTGAVFNAGIKFEQPIYMGGKIRNAYRLGQLGEILAVQHQALTETEVIYNTDKAYALAIRAREMGKVADSYHDVVAELMRNVESAYRHGMKPQNDVLKVQVRLNESELNQRRVENARRLAMMNLCHAVGLPLTDSIVVAEEYPTASDISPVANLADVTARPEFAMLSTQVSIAEQQVKLNRAELLPQVGLMGMYGYTNGFKVNDEKLFDSANFAVGLNVSIPIYHFGERSNKVSAAKAKAEQARMERESVTEQMQLELSRAATDLDEAILEVALAERSLAQAAENMRVSKSQYDHGLETLSNYLEAQLLWQQAYNTLIDSRCKHYLCGVNLLRASGRLRI